MFIIAFIIFIDKKKIWFNSNGNILSNKWINQADHSKKELLVYINTKYMISVIEPTQQKI